jgi:hypothetical protein
LDVDELAESEGDDAKEPEKPVVEMVDTGRRYLLMGQVEIVDAGKDVRIDGT